MLNFGKKVDIDKQLLLFSTEQQFELKLHDNLKIGTTKINEEVMTLKDDHHAQRNYLLNVNQKISLQMSAYQQITQQCLQIQEKMKADLDKKNKERKIAIQQTQKLEVTNQQIKDTIQKIKQAVNDSIYVEARKRQKIKAEIQKSLDDIKQKINTFKRQSQYLDIENYAYKFRNKQIQGNLCRLQVQIKQKSNQMDNSVKKQRQQLLMKYQLLQEQITEVNQIKAEMLLKQKLNKQRGNSLCQKIKKFPDYMTSFQSSAKTIDQCKEQLCRGVQRMNDAKQMIQKSEKQLKEFHNLCSIQLKKKSQKETSIQAVKKEKQAVRQRIIALQNRIKQQKTKTTD